MAVVERNEQVELDGLRITLGQPRMVAEGVGHYWFPDIAHFPTGELYLRVNRAPDSEGNLISGASVFISSDQGQSWEMSYDVAMVPSIIISRRDGSLAGPIFHLYPETLGPSRCFRTHYISLGEGGNRYKMEPWAVEVEGLPRDVRTSRYQGKWSHRWMNQIYFDGDAVQLDAEVLATAYTRFAGDEQ